MFITGGKATYTKDGDQKAKGRFLMVFDHPDDKVFDKKRPLRCLIRPVTMQQLGHWMMAKWTHDGYTLSLSGTYGGDGLPISTAANPDKQAFVRKLWDQLTPMPDDILALFWHDDGHNSSGKNGPSIHAWAVANLKELSKLK
jgi:hypothetical protein